MAGVLGINLNGNSYFSPELQFTNLFKRCELVSNRNGQQWGQGGMIPLDSNGYPTSLESGQFATWILFEGQAGVYWPSGTYTFRWEGTGTFEFAYGSASIVSSTANQIVWNVAPGSSFFINQTATGSGSNYAKNFRVYQGAPGSFDESQRYNTEFLGYCSNFDVIRYMDFLATNNNPLVSWTDRTKLTSVSWAKNGGPYECCIEVSQAANAIPWICIPHAANDDYIVQLCNLLNTLLPNDGRVYLEYTNEFWNGIFSQGPYCGQQGEALGLGTGFGAAVRFYSNRLKFISQTAKGILGPKVKIVAGGQAPNLGVAGGVLEYNNNYQFFDYMGIAPYVAGKLDDPAKETEVAAMTLNQYDTAMRNEFAEIQGWITGHKNMLTSQFPNVQLVNYEFGQHMTTTMFSPSSGIFEKFRDYNRSTLIYDMYQDYFDMIVPQAEISCYFNLASMPSRFGYWGMMEQFGLTAGDPKRRKYDAVLQWIADNSGGTPANRKPTAFLNSNVSSGVAPLTVNFNAIGSSDPDPGDYILGYKYDFGDGSAISFQVAPSHTFTTPGTYTVSLIVQDSQLLESTPVFKTITVTSAPVGGTGTALTSAQEEIAGRISSLSGLSKTEVLDTAIELTKGMRQVNQSLDDLV